ncbi:integrase [Streptococcus pneumoniae]|nr:integrase [Streptococcus pneumoniae]VLT89623.1 integrase [Streptococcus pneumoniae]VMG98014.1 integrase [Streptococcus pneumoniae]VQX70518.1 integrase [Streptococcus pneumoniae]
MYYVTKTNSKGQPLYQVVEKYKDPLTDKWRTVTVSYTKNTSRARKQAEREVMDKIEKLTSSLESQYNPEMITTFGELKESWFQTWCVSVKPQTIKREELVIERLGKIIGDEFLLDRITPLLMKNCLNKYLDKYDASPSTMTHIKSTCNKIFNHGVLYNVIKYSPMTAVKIDVPLEKKREARKRLDAKFLEIHELQAFFDVLGQCRNASYYDLAIVLLLTGIRIGEAAFLPSDVDFDKGILHIDKALQYHDLKVDEFYFDTTKTVNADREVALPIAASEAIQRAIKRNQEFEAYMEQNPSPAFKKCDSVFQTEYGSPITSHSFRQVLKRVEEKLLKNCQKDYGFKWVKHVTPHSFRHMHISYLQSNEMHIAVKDIMTRVGHANFETTMGYTHNISRSQENTVTALNQFVEKHNFHFKELKSYTCKYSRMIEQFIETCDDNNKVELSVDEFKDLLHLGSRYSPKHIVSNLLLKIKKDIVKYHPQFDIKIVKLSGNQIKGFSISW